MKNTLGVLTEERAAFRAGWYVNAATEDQSAEYLAECEDADWREYQARKRDVLWPTKK
jgi:hypothetical protein